MFGDAQDGYSRNTTGEDMPLKLMAILRCVALCAGSVLGGEAPDPSFTRKIRLDRDNAFGFVFFLPSSVHSGHGPTALGVEPEAPFAVHIA